MGELLAGRTIVVTGGAQGIGRAFALRFADEGANVVVADVNLERAERVVSEIPGDNVLAAEVDFSRRAPGRCRGTVRLSGRTRQQRGDLLNHPDEAVLGNHRR